MNEFSVLRLVTALIIAAYMSIRGLKKRSLSPSGAVAAFIVGFLSFAIATTFGVMLIAFYLSGSRATSVKQSLKRKWDLDVKGGEGDRGVIQVLCTAGFPVALSVLHVLLAGLEGAGPRLDFCISSSTAVSTIFIGVLASYAAACGDTWASELGILSRGPPVLIVGCRRVPRGTNGGVSLWGLFMSLCGGAFIGAVALATIALEDTLMGAASPGLRPLYCTAQAWLVPLGAICGLSGSVIDSLLGAVLQRSYVDASSGRASCLLPPGAIVSSNGDLTSQAMAAQQVAATGATDTNIDPDKPLPMNNERVPVYVIVSGYAILSNEQVNLLSGILTAALAMYCCHISHTTGID